jgi:lysophospholipase
MAALAQPGKLEAIDIPGLLLAAGHDRLVSLPAIRRAAARLPNSELIVFGQESRHELLRERDPVRDKALAMIDRFLDRLEA